MTRWTMMALVWMVTGCASPEKTVCDKLQSVCESEYSATCEKDMEALRKSAGEEAFKELNTCVSEASSCGGVTGCLVPIALKAGMNELGDFGKSLMK